MSFRLRLTNLPVVALLIATLLHRWGRDHCVFRMLCNPSPRAASRNDPMVVAYRPSDADDASLSERIS
jgi:hypothetical protein